MTMPVYALTGASGHGGRYAVHQLLARGVQRGAEAPPATCQARITAAAAAGRRAGCNLRPCGSRLVSAGPHLLWEEFTVLDWLRGVAKVLVVPSAVDPVGGIMQKSAFNQGKVRTV